MLVRPIVVFDLDGTLIDSAPLITDLINAMLADRGAGRRVTIAETRPHVVAGGRRAVAALLGDHAGDPDLAMAEFRERYAATPTPAGSLYPGAGRALAALAGAGFGLAVWSNKAQELCDKVIAELGLRPLFGAVVGTGPATPLKPDPRGLDLALAGAGGGRAACCYVGDSEVDYEVARLAAVPMVMMTHGYGDYRRAWPGAALAASFGQLPAIVHVLCPARAPA